MYPLRPPPLVLHAALLTSSLLLGCATREVPARYPASSAAAPDAQQAVPLAVTTSLKQDPPLPGDAQDGWERLHDDNNAQPAAPAPHSHHGHHHHGH